MLYDYAYRPKNPVFVQTIIIIIGWIWIGKKSNPNYATTKRLSELSDTN